MLCNIVRVNEIAVNLNRKVVNLSALIRGYHSSSDNYRSIVQSLQCG